MAAADPGGVGQDFMFTNDGQFGFTVFPHFITAAIDMFGVAQGAKLVSLAGLLLWIGALVSLAAAMAKGRLRWVIVLFVLVLPASYGGFHVFHYAEPMAVPRTFPEAAVLFAFALMCRGRRLAALVPLAAAALFHPIMALPGLGVWTWLTFFDPEERVFSLPVSLACAGGAVALLLLAAAFHVPVADRLFVTIDPAFGEMISARTPDLLPVQWPAQDWSRLLVQFATLAIATRVVSGRLRSLFIATMVIGVVGLAAAHFFGSVFGSLLAVQVQSWRSVWIVAVLAAAALAICSVQLWRQGGNARLTLGWLVIAWLGAETIPIALSAAGLAFILAFWRPAQTRRIDPKLTFALWGFVGCYALLTFGIRLYGVAAFSADAPDGSWNIVSLLSMFGVWSMPVCALAAVYALTKPSERLLLPLSAAAVVLAVLGVVLWDVRDARTVEADTAAGDPALRALLSSRPGAVLWLDGRFDTWSLAGR
ncbi:MAG TPA: hypothetical protein VMW57_06960 [Methyloceanibacter sp.]|nr:hypothetical protein [Methyloceanibacter sp.]